MDLWDWEMDEFFNRGNAFDLLTDETLCTNCQFSFGSRPWKETSPDSQRVDDIFPRRSQVLGNEKWFSSNLQVDDVHFKRLSDTKAFNQFVAAPTICCCAFLRTVKIDASRGIFNFFLLLLVNNIIWSAAHWTRSIVFSGNFLLRLINRVHWFYGKYIWGWFSSWISIGSHLKFYAPTISLKEEVIYPLLSQLGSWMNISSSVYHTMEPEKSRNICMYSSSIALFILVLKFPSTAV